LTSAHPPRRIRHARGEHAFLLQRVGVQVAQGDVAVALTASLATQSVPVATAAAALRKLAENLKLLT
jgi:hypothetical protein